MSDNRVGATERSRETGAELVLPEGRQPQGNRPVPEGARVHRQQTDREAQDPIAQVGEQAAPGEVQGAKDGGSALDRAGSRTSGDRLEENTVSIVCNSLENRRLVFGKARVFKV